MTVQMYGPPIVQGVVFHRHESGEPFGDVAPRTGRVRRVEFLRSEAGQGPLHRTRSSELDYPKYRIMRYSRRAQACVEYHAPDRQAHHFGPTDQCKKAYQVTRFLRGVFTTLRPKFVR